MEEPGVGSPARKILSRAGFGYRFLAILKIEITILVSNIEVTCFPKKRFGTGPVRVTTKRPGIRLVFLLWSLQDRMRFSKKLSSASFFVY